MFDLHLARQTHPAGGQMSRLVDKASRAIQCMIHFDDDNKFCTKRVAASSLNLVGFPPIS
jgi:hypothetical protein